MRTYYLFLFSALLLGIPLFASDGERADPEGEEDPIIFDVESYGEEWLLGDTSGDGQVDYALRRNDAGEKAREAVDFNGDGYMDDFYFYDRRGVLVRQELDTNHDQEIDLWVYLHRGVYVSGYRRDTDYDGRIDLEKEFGEEE
ncbi:MAG: hypothetical protein ACOC28_07965 [Alkalispirochaetaceae bacterium]